MALDFGNKVENGGIPPQGVLRAEEFNELVAQVNQNEEDIAELGTPNSIESIEVTESQASGGNNVITITETNGTETTFNVKNGEDGVDLGEVAIADNLTTDDATKVLSAKQGYVVGTRLDELESDVAGAGSGISSLDTRMEAAEGEINEMESQIDNCYTMVNSLLTFSIEVGKQRVPAYGFAITDNPSRCTISSILTTEDLAYAKRMVSPQGYQANFVQAKALSKNADNIATGWKGGSFVIEDVLDDEYPYKIFNFRRTDDGNVSDSDGVIIANGFHVEIEAPSAIDFIGKNGSIAKSVFNDSDTEKVEVYTKDAVDELARQAVGFVTKGDGSMTYDGAPINLSSNTFVKVPLTNLMQGTGRQGGAVYDKYFFQFYINNPYIEVYELGETRIDLAQTIMMTENVNNHANAGGFGAKYDESDPFPLLYIASADEYRVYVYRLTGALPNLTIQLHQTITLPSATDLVYFPSIAIDTVSNELVVYGYTKDTWRDGTDNKSVVAYYDIPTTSGDQTVSVSDEKARYYLPFIYAMQGACVRNGKLYLSWGNVATTLGGGVIVFHKGIIESSIDFAAVGRYEPEAVGIYNDALYVSTQSGRMVKLTF